MRTLVFLLILANMLFFAWSQDYLGLSRSSDDARARQQLQAERIRIVSNDTPPADNAGGEKLARPAEKPPVPPSPPVDICMQLSDMPVADAEQLESLIAESLPAFKTTRTTTPGTSNYWVHIPPAKNKRDADNNAAELKRLGIREFFVVQDNGPNNLAISLGLFSTRESAASALEQFRSQGIRQAKVTERVVRQAVAQLEIRGPDSNSEELNQFIVQQAKGTKRGTCKLRNTS